MEETKKRGKVGKKRNGQQRIKLNDAHLFIHS